MLRQHPLLQRYEIVVDYNIPLNQFRMSFAEALKQELNSQHSDKVNSSKSNSKFSVQQTVPDLSCESAFSRVWDRAAADFIADTTGTVVLRDLNTGKYVSSRDIGFGLSQIIPVLAQACSYGGIIAVEQPELHIHPALQAELGDVFIRSALQQENTFLIETHSEHLVLRIMRRIRETSRGKLPRGKQALRPEDVCILYVEPGESGSIVREMPVNDQGELVKAWPGGFFEEGLNEMFDT